MLRICSYLSKHGRMLHSCLSNIKMIQGTHYGLAGIILHLGIAITY